MLNNNHGDVWVSLGNLYAVICAYDFVNPKKLVFIFLRNIQIKIFFFCNLPLKA